MPRKLVLIHGYSDKGEAFFPLRDALAQKGITLTDINICTYVSLNNEITIKDIAEGLERAFRTHPDLKASPNFEFDAIVHSTGMLVIRSWLTNYGARPGENQRLKRLKHLIGLAPATWGSPQAHKGRTWLGALVKGNRDFGPDFLNAGDRVLEGLELGSSFTWDLAHLDLLGKEPYYDKGPNTPFVAVFIGNTPYQGLETVANDPGTDGTVRWAGCGLNTRKIRIDLTQSPMDTDGNLVPVDTDGIAKQRVWITEFALNRLDIPMIAVDGRNHGSIIHNPEPGMVDLISRLLKVGDPGAETYDRWVEDAKEYSKKGLPKMLVNPDVGFFKRIIGSPGEKIEGWQQFVVHARDERGDPVTDYMIEVIKDGQVFKSMYTDVHAYGPDSSYRCFYIHLPQGISDPTLKLRARINASTGTDLMAYQGYNQVKQQLTEDSEPIELDLDLGPKDSLFFPFTTTLIEIVLNREPLPFNAEAKILTFFPQT
jgi:hypothetical protein